MVGNCMCTRRELCALAALISDLEIAGAANLAPYLQLNCNILT